MTGGVNITDVTLTGSATWNGSDTGTVTLKALGIGESRIDLTLGNGTRTEIRDAQTGSPLGQWTTSHASGSFAYHNCMTDAAWFFPALGSLAAPANTVLSYIGQESRKGVAVQHIQSSVPSVIQGLSTADFYLDATTMLPVAVTFNTHPDNDASKNLPIEIDFSSYQTVSGTLVPMHIQKYQQGNLILDLVLSGASFNSGIALTTFAVN